MRRRAIGEVVVVLSWCMQLSAVEWERTVLAEAKKGIADCVLIFSLGTRVPQMTAQRRPIGCSCLHADCNQFVFGGQQEVHVLSD